jgi:hypothetical protein
MKEKTLRKHQKILNEFLKYKTLYSDKPDEYAVACVANDTGMQRNTIRKIVYDIRVRDKEAGEVLTPSQIRRDKLKKAVFGRYMEISQLKVTEKVMWRVIAEETGISCSCVRNWVKEMIEKNKEKLPESTLQLKINFGE